MMRKQDWGGWLVDEPLAFYRGSTELRDTVCLISVGTVEPVEVLPASVAYQEQPSGVAAERKEQKNSGALSRAQHSTAGTEQTEGVSQEAEGQGSQGSQSLNRPDYLAAAEKALTEQEKARKWH